MNIYVGTKTHPKVGFLFQPSLPHRLKAFISANITGIKSASASGPRTTKAVISITNAHSIKMGALLKN